MKRLTGYLVTTGINFIKIFKMNIELRDPNTIMKLSRLGSFHQSKLSFLRSFLKEFKDWDYKRDLFNLDEDGFGTAVYSFSKKERVYSLVCFANRISSDERSDRVIATKWDAAFTLHDGVPSKQDIERLRNEVPKQEVGRLSYKELTLSRANKSVRIFDHVVNSLSNGIQPDLKLLESVGLGHRISHYPHELSGGEQQRVAIARSLISSPEILIADEPTGNLDKKNSKEVIELIFKLQKIHKSTLILVTHDKSLADLCDQTIILDNGIIL